MAQTLKISSVGQPTKEIVSLFPKQGEWTEEDYYRLPETNRIIELSEGKLIMTPAPTTQHQLILGDLFLLIGNYVLSNNLGKIVTSPVEVRLWKGKIRQPDIAFMSSEHLDRITKQDFGVPDLAVEMLSKSTAETDRKDKLHEYEKAGVSEYWIVDPDAKTIEIYALENKAYILLGKWGIGEIASSKLLDGFKVSVDEIMV